MDQPSAGAGTLRVALLVPCRNEAATVAEVVAAFRCLPQAQCHVLDNASDDGTAELARQAGAVVHPVPLRGKGNVVRRAFADIEADVYVMVDGDATYDAEAAPRLVRRLLEEGWTWWSVRVWTRTRPRTAPGTAPATAC